MSRVDKDQDPREVLGRLSLKQAVCARFQHSLERGQMGLEMDSRKAIWLKELGIGGQRGKDRRAREGGWKK